MPEGVVVSELEGWGMGWSSNRIQSATRVEIDLEGLYGDAWNADAIRKNTLRMVHEVPDTEVLYGNNATTAPERRLSVGLGWRDCDSQSGLVIPYRY